MPWIVTAAFLVPLALAWLLTRGMIALAPRIGLVDRPAARKLHAKVTPLGGGVAIHLSVVLTLGVVVGVAWLAESSPTVAGWLPDNAAAYVSGVLYKAPLLGMLLLAATVQMALGLVDDWRPAGLDYRFRLGVEVVLVLLLVTQGIEITLFSSQRWLTVTLTVLWIVGLTNAMNFLDNMDGLSAGVGLIASWLFAVVGWLVGDLFVSGGFLVLAGALLGYLRYNWNPAKIFMGDAGSNFLGFWLGVLTVTSTFHDPRFAHVTVFAPLCILAVPIYDSTTVILLRLSQGRSPFHPDKQHFSHRLMELGFRPKAAVLTIGLLGLTTGLGGLLLYFVAPASASILVLGQVACVLGVVATLEAVAWRTARRREE